MRPHLYLLPVDPISTKTKPFPRMHKPWKIDVHPPIHPSYPSSALVYKSTPTHRSVPCPVFRKARGKKNRPPFFLFKEKPTYARKRPMLACVCVAFFAPLFLFFKTPNCERMQRYHWVNSSLSLSFSFVSSLSFPSPFPLPLSCSVLFCPVHPVASMPPPPSPNQQLFSKFEKEAGREKRGQPCDCF